MTKLISAALIGIMLYCVAMYVRELNASHHSPYGATVSVSKPVATTYSRYVR